MSTLTDNDQKSKIDKEYEQGSGTYLREAENTRTLGNSDQSGASSGDGSSDALRDDEQNPSSNWKTNLSSNEGKQIDKPKLLNALRLTKKRGGVIGLISLFGIGGALLAGFFGPTSMLVNLVENFAISNDSSSTVLERRFAKVFGNLAESDSETLCAKGTNISCRMGRLSNSSLKQLNKKGVVALNGQDPIDFSKGKYPDKNPTHYRFVASDGSNNDVPAAQLREFLANKDNRKYAAKLLGTGGAFNLRVKAWAGNHIQTKFFNKFNLSKKGGLADGSTTKHQNAHEKLAAAQEKLLGKIPGVETLKGMDVRIKTTIEDKMEKTKGGGTLYTLASAGCIASKAPAIISAGVAGVQLARLLPIVNELVLSPGSKLKASGVDKANAVTGGDIDTIGTLLTNKTKNSEGKMTSALDSPYLLAAMGVNKNKPAVSAKFAPGYSILSNPTMQNLRTAGKSAAPTCNVILNPVTMVAAAVLDAAVTKTNPAGAIAGFVVGGVVSAVAEPIVTKVIQEVGGAVIASIADNDNLKNLKGQELGDAVGVSAFAFFASGSMARDIPTLTEGQVVAFESMKKDTETLQKEMDIASLSPFDTSSRYTLLGSMVNTMQMAVLANGGYDGSSFSVLSSLAQLPQSILSTNASAANFTTNNCSYASSFDLETDVDTPAINVAGLPCTGITAEQDAMSTKEAAALMISRGWVDGEKVVPDNATIDDLLAQEIIKKDTPLAAYIDSCSDASTGDYLFEAAGCTVSSVPGADSRALAAMSVFLIDFQLAQLTNGEDEEKAGSSNASSTTLENSGKVNPEGWAYPLDSPQKLVTYAGHNGDDISVPENTKVYSMREGKVIATEIQSVAEMEALAFCPSFAKINGPQKNLMIESVVDGKTYTIRYAHLNEFKVKVGDVVKAGDVIALSGNTGCTDGAHLHIDINAGEIYPRDIFGTSF